eukprot:CAMPEP_0170332968 /NCGR_PEP_ID=MMETSP0116_2-20130129/67500_1 /TAXON_ID=400756 /ORGANISM="Durinskia baltica, Strain CSIRO CS-38" /LENGTH=291 /DNA_ID=CAMNT_0010586303 /DNA_START=222 /DNA_END=1094 /DNA_ORIENTATION=+
MNSPMHGSTSVENDALIASDQNAIKPQPSFRNVSAQSTQGLRSGELKNISSNFSWSCADHSAQWLWRLTRPAAVLRKAARPGVESSARTACTPPGSRTRESRGTSRPAGTSNRKSRGTMPGPCPGGGTSVRARLGLREAAAEECQRFGGLVPEAGELRDPRQQVVTLRPRIRLEACAGLQHIPLAPLPHFVKGRHLEGHRHGQRLVASLARAPGRHSVRVDRLNDGLGVPVVRDLLLAEAIRVRPRCVHQLEDVRVAVHEVLDAAADSGIGPEDGVLHLLEGPELRDGDRR